MQAIACSEPQAVAHVCFGIEIGRRRRRVWPSGKRGKIDAAGIDDGELEEAACGQCVDVCKALGRLRREWADANSRRGYRRVDWHIDLGANALDDARIDLPVKGLRPTA